MDTYESRLKSPELDDVFHAILSLRDLTECYRFFEDMCTINELQAMAQRWQVARQLDADVTYQDISHKFQRLNSYHQPRESLPGIRRGRISIDSRSHETNGVTEHLWQWMASRLAR